MIRSMKKERVLQKWCKSLKSNFDILLPDQQVECCLGPLGLNFNFITGLGSTSCDKAYTLKSNATCSVQTMQIFMLRTQNMLMLHCVLETALPIFSQSCPTVVQISDNLIKNTQSPIFSTQQSPLRPHSVAVMFIILMRHAASIHQDYWQQLVGAAICPLFCH